MLYIYFQPTILTSQYLKELQKAREELDPYARLPQEYTVQLRRHALAQAVHYSTRIEGNTLTLAQVRSLLAGEKVGAPVDQIQEVRNYAEALSYIQTFSQDKTARISEDTIRQLHFLITKSLPGGYAPGQHRTEQNYVIDSRSDRRVFIPPASENVPVLMREFVDWLNSDYQPSPVLKAALAHLNVVAIHPFLDGNGRTARVLESLLLYKEGVRSQYLVSLEAYFGRDSQAYYHALAAALGPYYSPPKDVSLWVEYSLQAHVVEAHAALQYQQEVTVELDGLKEVFQTEGLSPAQTMMLLMACRTERVTNREYRQITGRSHQSAVADFTKLIEKGLLARSGKGRATAYVPSQRTKEVFESIRRSP